MTEIEIFLFTVLVALSGYLYWSLTRSVRLELASQKAAEKAIPGKGFEAATISPQINRLRQNFIIAARSHRIPSCNRKQRVAIARYAVSQLSFFRKLHPDSPVAAEQQHGETATRQSD